jgi:hypothetical protein
MEFTVTTRGGQGFYNADIFDLMAEMWLDNIETPQSVAFLNQARNLWAMEGQRIADLMVEGDEAVLDAIKENKGRDLAYWVSKACEQDSDFVEEAVSHIIGGTAQKFFE